MKKLMLLLTIIAFALTAQAKVWRVNNNAGINADYTNFTAAQNTANANDTLYFEGSATTYGNIIISKSLVMIGPGYFLNENPQTQVNLVTAKFGTITFNTGSSGTTIAGFEVTGNITINVGDIIIKNNYTKAIYINSTNSFGNILISQNYVNGGIDNSNGTAQIYNVIISNNYIKWNGYQSSSINFGTNYSGIITNNNFECYYSLSVHNFSIINNIYNTGNSVMPTDNTFFNNICNHTQAPTGNGNQQNITLTDVFVGATGNSTDGQYQLKQDSPAIGAGNDGKDCGMFGGATPYILSGLPSIPSVYEINMPATGDNINGIDVTIKAKAH